MYYLIFGLFYLLSLLPFWLLYLIADGLYLLLYYLVGYRKEVIFNHLEQAFPEKTKEERQTIAKKFLKNLADHMVENIKMMSISKKQIRKRFSCDTNIFDYLEKKELSYQIYLGHVFNWEWANLFIRLIVKRPFLVIYKPLSNKNMNRLFNTLRGRFGTSLISSKRFLKEMKPFRGSTYTSVLVADQYPKGGRAFWFPFLHKMTPFFKGPEIQAKRDNLAVVFGHIHKVRRGYYKIETVLAFESSREADQAEITGKYVRFLEKRICKQPENWLWSHRRWKRKWKGEINK